MKAGTWNILCWNYTKDYTIQYNTIIQKIIQKIIQPREKERTQARTRKLGGKISFLHIQECNKQHWIGQIIYIHFQSEEKKLWKGKYSEINQIRNKVWKEDEHKCFTVLDKSN